MTLKPHPEPLSIAELDLRTEALCEVLLRRPYLSMFIGDCDWILLRKLEQVACRERTP